jgi:SAM-dependent methyltransferase
MKLEQLYYSIVNWNLHYENIEKELSRLEAFLLSNQVEVESAIDVGCGDGKVTKKLRDLLGLRVIYGLDLNKRLLERARKRGIHTIQGDMESIRIQKKFDIVISYGSLHHARDTKLFIGNLKGISRKYLLIVDNTVRRTLFHKMTGSRYSPIDRSPFPIRSKAEIIGALEQSGCTVLDGKTMLNDNFWHDISFVLATVWPMRDHRPVSWGSLERRPRLPARPS